MEPEPFSGHTTPIASPKIQSTAQSPVKDEASIKSDEHNRRSSDVILSQVSDSPNKSTLHRLSSSTLSPSLQVMERPEDVSNRCSSSSEWSSVSNESLFSIHITHSAHLLVADTFKYDDLTSSMDHSTQSHIDSLKVDSLCKLDARMSSLDEPQKVVRWKTQVERLADEGVPSQGHQWESSPMTNHSSSTPKKKFCWSLCECGSCNLLKWSCWNDCWKCMSCSNCKPKKVCSSHSFAYECHTKEAGFKTFEGVLFEKDVLFLDLGLPAPIRGHVLAIAAEEAYLLEHYKQINNDVIVGAVWAKRIED